MSKEAFFRAIAGQESGGNYDSTNSSSGAFGKYQIMPDNWPSWAEEAGLSRDAEQTPENQEIVAKYKLGQLYDTYGAAGAMVAWYAGDENAKAYVRGDSTDIWGRGWYQPQSNGPAIGTYADEVTARMNSDTQEDSPNIGANQEPQGPQITPYNLPTQGGDIDEQVARLKPAFREALPLIGGILAAGGLGEGSSISSAARTPEHNAEVGGVAGSYHIDNGDGGDAVDIVLPDGTTQESANAILQKLKDTGAFTEVLFHDVGSGYHLHLGGYNGSLVGKNTPDAPQESTLTPNELADLDTGWNPLAVLGNQLALSNGGAFHTELDPIVMHPTTYEPSALSIFGGNVWDAIDSSWWMGVGKMKYANIMKTSGNSALDRITDDDIESVKAALPNMKDAQEWAITHAKDRTELKWLVQQKQAEIKRKEELASWYNKHYIASTLGQVAGAIVDPAMLIPLGEAVGSIKIMSRLGGAIADTMQASKVARIAATGVETGTEMAAINAMTEKIKNEDWGWGDKPDYTHAAMVGALSGTILGALGKGIGESLKAGQLASQGFTDAENVATKARGMQNYAMREAVDLAHIRDETKPSALALHDSQMVADSSSDLLKKFAARREAVLMDSAEAKQLLHEKAGIQLPDNAKAFFVPNEGYSIILKDRVKPEEMDDVLVHEIGAHGYLPALMGEKKYGAIMNQIDAEAKQRGTVMNEVRRITGQTDPEELLGYALQNDMLKGKLWKSIANKVRGGFKDTGYDLNMSSSDVKNMLMRNPKLSGEVPSAVYRNEDGTTAFAGIKFSKENLVSPDTFDNFYSLALPKDSAQAAFSSKLGKTYGKVTESGGIGNLWATPFGVMSNSVSNKLRAVGNQFFVDAQQRGMNKSGILTVERNQQRMYKALEEHIGRYFDEQFNWMKNENGVNVFGYGRKAALEADMRAELAYNEKYGGNRATPTGETDPHILAMVEHLKAYRDTELDLLKSSATGIGEVGKNMVEKRWFPVDHEFYRRTNEPLIAKFRSEFRGDAGEENAIAFLTDYCKKAAELKSDVIAAKLDRDAQFAYEDAVKAGDENAVLQKGTPQDVTDYIERMAKAEAEQLIKPWDETIHPHADTAKVGDIQTLKERLPMDTSMTMKLPSGMEFSFDKNLRDFETGQFLVAHGKRVSGEGAIQAHFGDTKQLMLTRERIKKELDTASADGAINRDRAEFELKQFDKAVRQMRGLKSTDDVSSVGKVTAACDILRDAGYFKFGAMMGFPQIGEGIGAASHGGLRALFHIHPWIRNTLDKISNGKLTDREYRDIAMHVHMEDSIARNYAGVWGNNKVRQAFNTNSWGDRVTRGLADAAANATKFTSMANQVGAMTKSQEQWLLTTFWGDVIRHAHGEGVGTSKSTIQKAFKAAGVLPAEYEKLTDAVRKYFPMGADNLPKDLSDEWKAADPRTYYQLYEAANAFKEAGIVNGELKGNASSLSDNNMYRMLFQFKTFSGRAWALSTRLMRDRDRDAAASIALHTIGGLAGFQAANFARYTAAVAAGNEEEAQQIQEAMSDPMNFGRAALVRAAALQPLSFANDIMEAWTGAQTVRTTTAQKPSVRGQARKGEDIINDFVDRIPAVRQVANLARFGYDIQKGMQTGGINQSMVKDFFNNLPLPNLLPLTELTKSVVGTYPKK